MTVETLPNSTNTIAVAKSTEDVAKDAEPSDVLTPEKSVELLYHMFRFAQQERELELWISDFFHAMHPNWTVDDAWIPQIKAELTKRVTKYVTPKPGVVKHAPLPDADNINENVDTVIKSFSQTINGVDNYPLDVIRQQLALRLVIQDAHFIVDAREVVGMDNFQHGRIRRGLKENTPMGDSFFSNVVYYGLQGNSTGITEYDEMFVAVREEIEGHPENTPLQDTVAAVSSQYYRNGLGRFQGSTTEPVRET